MMKRILVGLVYCITALKVKVTVIDNYVIKRESSPYTVLYLAFISVNQDGHVIVLYVCVTACATDCTGCSTAGQCDGGSCGTGTIIKADNSGCDRMY